jgi:lipopolysaccharide/colanic/teichoic acid biosynthesis glycosyltransferase
MYRRFAKRCFDLLVALPLCVLLAPVIAVLSVMVWFRLGRPVFFRQDRGGLGGTTFRICKFRTMLDTRNANGELLSDAERLTTFGKLLRATSLDELPTLIHVLSGSMSLVGPRPLPARYLPRYDARQARRHEAPPGVTGWAQVNGRNSISWDEKFRLDVWYVDHMSFALDLRILLMTVGKVLRRDGISAEGEATMSEFRGTGEPSHGSATDTERSDWQPSVLP